MSEGNYALLKELENKIKSGEISKEQVQKVLSSSDSKKISDTNVTKILYILGIAIVVFGILTFISQIWGDIGIFGRITLTLIMGFVFAALGSVQMSVDPKSNLEGVFHFIGGILIPIGTLITINELNLQNFYWSPVFSFGILLAFYLTLNTVHKSSILSFFSITNGTSFIYALSFALIQTFNINGEDILIYLTSTIGVSYLLLSYTFQKDWNKNLVGILNFFGVTFVLWPLFAKSVDSILWQIVYFPLVMGGMIVSIILKSRSILVMSTFFLIIFVSFITGKYFAESLGWPISLILLGFFFIGLGFVSITINNKYLKKQ